MLLFNTNNITKKIIGTVSQKDCPECKELSYWELCIARKWITILCLPLIPYKKCYCLVCNKCDHYIEIEENEFISLKEQISSGCRCTEPESLKYINKNQIQINYLKSLNSYKS